MTMSYMRVKIPRLLGQKLRRKNEFEETDISCYAEGSKTIITYFIREVKNILREKGHGAPCLYRRDGPSCPPEAEMEIRKERKKLIEGSRC